MSAFPYEMHEPQGPMLGLVVLQTDETIEADFARLLPKGIELNVSRVPSGDAVTTESLGAMEGHLTAAAALLPPARRFEVIGYGCTSGSAVIGLDRVAELVRAGAEVGAITNPLSALIAACDALGTRRLGLLSPYVEDVSAQLRERLECAGITTPVFGSFDEAEEARVVRIAQGSIMDAAASIAENAAIDGLFLSCTNLRTLEVIAPLEERLAMPVLSSNQVLAWHMTGMAGMSLSPEPWGRLASVASLSTRV